MGSLDNLHDKIDMASDKGFAKVGLDICAGLKTLHASTIIHGDLACRNLLMKADGTVALCDFGLAHKLGQYHDYYVVSEGRKFPWAWTDPHTLRTGRFDLKSDIWSLGVTFLELLTKGERPYWAEICIGMGVREIMQGVKDGSITLKVPETCPEACKRVIEVCFDLNRERRPTAEAVYELMTEYFIKGSSYGVLAGDSQAVQSTPNSPKSRKKPELEDVMSCPS